MSKLVKITGKVDAKALVTKNGYPEVGQFVDQKSLQKFYKQLDTDSLKEWVELEGITYKECTDSEQINRMRIAMAILYKHFPKDAPIKKESPYKAYSTEKLLEMAVEAEVAFEVCDDERILRMRAIMALRAAKAI